jgi:hypothetical protein
VLAGLDIGKPDTRGKILEIERMSLYPGSIEQWGKKFEGDAKVDEKLVRLKLDVLPPKHSLAMHGHCPAGCTRSHIASQPDDVGTRLPLGVRKPWRFST